MIREIAENAGEAYDRKALDKLAEKEAAKAKKK